MAFFSGCSNVHVSGNSQFIMSSGDIHTYETLQGGKRVSKVVAMEPASMPKRSEERSSEKKTPPKPKSKSYYEWFFSRGEDDHEDDDDRSEETAEPEKSSETASSSSSSSNPINGQASASQPPFDNGAWTFPPTSGASWNSQYTEGPYSQRSSSSFNTSDHGERSGHAHHTILDNIVVNGGSFAFAGGNITYTNTVYDSQGRVISQHRSSY
ncbi:hypothetical protein BKA70DRAFT_1278607 [Coprinopsis sp. MPI-PUGE-AT-0042]|nr:hypothetical protein BKA70DRAFT_1278607 [Coprinopsis sp. MPI-PUGE-AT-0042]